MKSRALWVPRMFDLPRPESQSMAKKFCTGLWNVDVRYIYVSNSFSLSLSVSLSLSPSLFLFIYLDSYTYKFTHTHVCICKYIYIHTHSRICIQRERLVFDQLLKNRPTTLNVSRFRFQGFGYYPKQQTHKTQARDPTAKGPILYRKI